MKKTSALFLLSFLLCCLQLAAQSGQRATAQPSPKVPTKSPSGSPAPVADASSRPNAFHTESYNITVESVQRKANNYTVTLVFESLSDNVVKLKLGGNGEYYWEKEGPYLLDEKSNKYLLQGEDSERVVNSAELFPRTKLKTQFRFYGEGGGTTFTFMTAEYSPVRGRPVVIKGLKVTAAEPFNDEAKFVTESYRVTVESVKRNADNVEVVLVFESLSDVPFNLTLGNRESDSVWQTPYLIDENADKYLVRVRSDPDQAKPRPEEPVLERTELLPGTKAKADLKFYGTGSGTSFTLITKEQSPKRDRPIVLRGLRPDSAEAPARTAITQPTAAPQQAPTFETESYKVVVTDVQRNANTITVTLVFESLLDKTFEVAWGRGGGGDDEWHSEEPYLIDENADRYYLRNRDDGKVVDCLWCPSANLLPGTKLKTHFVFNASSNGTTFTLGCKEVSPKPQRPIVIRGLKLN